MFYRLTLLENKANVVNALSPLLDHHSSLTDSILTLHYRSLASRPHIQAHQWSWHYDSDLSHLRDQVDQLLYSIQNRNNIDWVWQQQPQPELDWRLAVFDMDSTLIQAEVIDQLAYTAGIGESVATITAQCMAGGMDFQQGFRQRLSLLAGFPIKDLETIYNSIKLMPGAERLMRNLVALGVHCVIISGGFGYFANRLAQHLGMQEAYANPLEQQNGRLTGTISVPILDAERKLELLEQLTQKKCLQPWQTIAVGDGANDLPMLLKAGLGVAFHAKPLVQQKAHHRINQFNLDTLLYIMGYGDDVLLN